MQETLAPALMLFESDRSVSQTVGTTDAAGSSEEVVPNSSHRRQLRERVHSHASVQDTTHRWWQGGLRFAMAAGIGALIAWNVSGLFGMRAESSPMVTPDSAQCLWKSPEKAGDLDQQAIVVSCVTCHLQHGVQTAR